MKKKMLFIMCGHVSKFSISRESCCKLYRLKLVSISIVVRRAHLQRAQAYRERCGLSAPPIIVSQLPKANNS